MSEEATPKKLRQTRGGHRSSAKRLMSTTQDVLEVFNTGEDQQLKLQQLKQFIQEKRVTLKTLDEEILNLIDENDIDEEVEQCDILQEQLSLLTLTIETALAKSAHNAISSVTQHGQMSLEQTPSKNSPLLTSQPTPNSPAVRLPKLELRKLSGDLSTWSSFLDTYEADIHNNANLAAIDKFNYLKSLLEKNASDAISGLSLTAANYDEAIVILKRRFGNKQLIIKRHMEILLGMHCVTSDHNLIALRQIYDTVETNIRSLKSLGVFPETYGSIMTPVLMDKLPIEMRITVSRELKNDNWELDKLLNILRLEVEARERTKGEAIPRYERPRGEAIPRYPNSSQKTNYYPKFSQAASYPTATALFSNTTTYCTYCKSPHRTNACSVVTNIATRKEILRGENRCYVCLRKGHILSQCTAGRGCLRCGGKHHISLCLPHGNNQSYHQPPSNNKYSSVNNRQPFSNNHVSRATSLYVDNSKSSVMLQTARCDVFNLNRSMKANVRMIFDSGSQRSYMTAAIRNYLGLRKIGEKLIIIKTFGSNEERQQLVDVVVLCLQTNSGYLELSFCVFHLSVSL